MQGTESKGIIAVISGVFGYIYNGFNALIVVLGLLEILDFITGLAVGYKTGTLNPKKAMEGFLKKLGYLVAVMLGLLFDFTITYLSEKIGLEIKTNGLLATIVTSYLIGKEGVSVSTNLIKLNVPIPRLLKEGFRNISATSEKVYKESVQTIFHNAPDEEKKVSK